MKKYIILTGLKISELENTVNNYVQSGYIPIGGITIHKETEKTTKYYQAVLNLNPKK